MVVVVVVVVDGVIIIGRRGSIGSIGSIGAIGNTGAIGSTPGPTGGSGFTPDITWFPTPMTPGFPSVVLVVGGDFSVFDSKTIR